MILITQYSIFLMLIELKYELERMWNIPINNGSGFHIWPNYTNKIPLEYSFFSCNLIPQLLDQTKVNHIQRL
jgi:hypothetical protein